MKIINLFAGPSVGKSTTAAALFCRLKMFGANVELVTEYAKDMVWEKRGNVLEDQLYILAKQNRRLSRLEGLVDYVVTDSPLLLGLAYTKADYFPTFKPFVLDIWNSYNNINFYLIRSPKNKYQAIGREQNSLEEAMIFDKKVASVLNENNIDYTPILCEGAGIISEIMTSLTVN